MRAASAALLFPASAPRTQLAASQALLARFPPAPSPRNMKIGEMPMSTKTQPLTGQAPAASLTNEEILRYSRHLIMPEVGREGQLKLKAAKVLLIGTGGLGAPLGLYLTAAGVGNIGLVDFDVVDFTNLQRQVTFGTTDVGKPKTQAACARLTNLNPDVHITTYETKLTSQNAL